MGNLYTRIEPTRRGRAALPLRAPRHGAADRCDRAGRRGRHRAERAPARSSAPTTRRRSPAMLEATRRVLAEGRPHAGIELLFTPKEEVGLVGAYAFDHTPAARADGYVYDQAAPIGDRHPRRAVLAVDRGDVPRARGALRHAPGGRPVGDRRGRARDRRVAARPRRRGLDGERRHDHRRHRDEHRSRVVHVRRRGALARRAEARRARAGDAGRDHVRRRRRGVRRRDEGAQELPRLPVRDGPIAAVVLAARGARALRPRRSTYDRRAAPPTRTSSTSAACSASTSRTA